MTQILIKKFLQHKARMSGFTENRSFIKEEFLAVTVHFRDIRDQMGVIKIKRDL